MTGNIGSLVFVQRVYAQPTNQNLNLDRFGFLQKSTSDDNAHTFTWNISNISYTGETQVSSGPALPGDYSNDGTVDASDFIVWRHNNGTNVTLPNDTTPGVVNQADYDVWRANFGNVLPAAPAAPSNLQR